jgi:hypothetical protein
MGPALGSNSIFAATLRDNGGTLFVICHITNYTYLFV